MLKYESFLLIPLLFKVTSPVYTRDNGAQREERLKKTK